MMNLARSRGIARALGACALGLGAWIAVAGCSSATSTVSPAAATSAATSGTPGASVVSTAASAPANAAPVPAANGRPFVLWDCQNKPRVEPSSFVLACADGNYGLQGVHWTKWAPTGAVGVGTEYLNDCLPDCAAGHFHTYPVDIKLTGSNLVAQNEPFAYSRLTLTYPAKRAPFTTLVNGKLVVSYPATFSVQLWVGHPAGAKYPAGAPQKA